MSGDLRGRLVQPTGVGTGGGGDQYGPRRKSSSLGMGPLLALTHALPRPPPKGQKQPRGKESAVDFLRGDLLFVAPRDGRL